MSFEIKIDIDKRTDKLIQQLPMLIHHKAMDKAAKAYAKPVLDRMILRAPDSRETRNRDKWGPKYAKDPKWTGITSGAHQDTKLFKTANGTILYVGPKWPKGNKQQFNDPKSGQRKHVLWGKDTGRVFRVTRRWQQRAFDESNQTALYAFRSVLRKEIEGAKLG